MLFLLNVDFIPPHYVNIGSTFVNAIDIHVSFIYLVPNGGSTVLLYGGEKIEGGTGFTGT